MATEQCRNQSGWPIEKSVSWEGAVCSWDTEVSSHWLVSLEEKFRASIYPSWSKFHTCETEYLSKILQIPWTSQVTPSPQGSLLDSNHISSNCGGHDKHIWEATHLTQPKRLQIPAKLLPGWGQRSTPPCASVLFPVKASVTVKAISFSWWLEFMLGWSLLHRQILLEKLYNGSSRYPISISSVFLQRKSHWVSRAKGHTGLFSK